MKNYCPVESIHPLPTQAPPRGGILSLSTGRGLAWTILGCIIVCLQSLVIPSVARGQRVSISLFDELALEQVSLTVLGDSSQLLLDGLLLPLRAGQRVTFQRMGNQVQITTEATPTMSYSHVAFLSRDTLTSFTLQPLLPHQAPARSYMGNLSLYVDYHRLMCINLVELNHYIGAVALAEIGGGAPIEALKAQTILVRTYLQANLTRHLSEGFNLCDGVHCQAYLGAKTGIERAIQAAMSTEGEVLVGMDSGELVPAVFHANCGGQTASAQQVWLKESPYMVNVVDPHCARSRGARWNHSIPLSEWKRFLESKGVDTRQLSPADYAWTRTTRELNYQPRGSRTPVPFRDLREYFQLRSAFFTVSVQGQKVLLKGRGYGHGCGLCQEGAIEMARKGHNAYDILGFYFRNIRVEKR